MTNPKFPLGTETSYPSHYDPSLLCPIARQDGRAALLAGVLPFNGVDIWNAWELTWLGARGLPMVATLELIVPATTPNIVESKSLKLYLNSFAMTSFDTVSNVRDTIAADISACTDGSVNVQLNLPQNAANSEMHTITTLPGDCLEDCWDDATNDSPACAPDEFADPNLLRANADDIADETLHSHLLRSLCPVTAQPDIGSLAIRYQGPKIDRHGLMQYLLSYREHNDYHEACVERMFVDILSRCAPKKLSIYARYQRRGGIDINPYRSNIDTHPPNSRLWRQ